MIKNNSFRNTNSLVKESLNKKENPGELNRGWGESDNFSLILFQYHF